MVKNSKVGEKEDAKKEEVEESCRKQKEEEEGGKVSLKEKSYTISRAIDIILLRPQRCTKLRVWLIA